MAEFKVPRKLIAPVKTTMEKTQYQIKIQNMISRAIQINNGLRQGDALALEKAIRDSGINSRGTIFYKSVQILAYADDIYIMGRTLGAMKEAFICLEKAAKR